MTKENMTRLVVSKINAIPLAKKVNALDWIEGIQWLTEASIEWKLVLKSVKSKKTKRNSKQTMNSPRSLRGNLR